MSGYWLIIRSDNKTFVVDDPERIYSIGRNPELPAAQQLHHKYISREHLRLRYAPPSLLVFQMGKNPTFYGNECHGVPGKREDANNASKLNAIEHIKEENLPLQTIANASVMSTSSDNIAATNSSTNTDDTTNDKGYESNVSDDHQYSKALVFCVSAHKSSSHCNIDSVVCKPENEQKSMQAVEDNGAGIQSNKCRNTDDDNVVYVDAMEREIAHNTPERECIEKSTLYFPDELHLPTLTIRYVQDTQVNSDTKENSHFVAASTNAKHHADNIEHILNGVNNNNADTVAAHDTTKKPTPTLEQMLAVPILKEEQEEEEEEEEEKQQVKLEHLEENIDMKYALTSVANEGVSTSIKSSEHVQSNLQHTNLSSKSNSNSNAISAGCTKAHEYRKEWQGLLNEAMKEEQQRLAEMKEEQQKHQQKEQQQEEEESELGVANEKKHVYINAKDKHTCESITNKKSATASGSKGKITGNKKDRASTRSFPDIKSSANPTQSEVLIPFGSSSTKRKSAKQKQPDLPERASARKRPRPSTTRRRGRGRGRSASSFSSSSASFSDTESSSSSESESSFTSTSSQSSSYDDEESSSSSESSSSETTDEERVKVK